MTLRLMTLLASVCLPFLTPAFAQADTALGNTSGADVTRQCELHVFPTENYLGFNSGLLSGFGFVGAVADIAAHEGRVKNVRELMKDYLGPDIQVEELIKLGFQKRLGLSGDYRLIIEQPMPSADDAKADMAVQANVKRINADIKAGKRLTTSTNPCYGELILFSIFYHKAAMYGSNLFVPTMFRDFSGGASVPVTSKGAVKNPLENFPPKAADMVEPAKAELRDAFARDFTEWTEKKLVKSAALSGNK